MEAVVVTNKQELRHAVSSGADEIIIANDDLIKHLKLIRKLRMTAPLVVSSLLAAIALGSATGSQGGALKSAHCATGDAFKGAATVFSNVSGMTIAAMVVALGGIVVVSLFTDFEEIEIAGIFKLKRKLKPVKNE
jgi:hypothetical protein